MNISLKKILLVVYFISFFAFSQTASAEPDAIITAQAGSNVSYTQTGQNSRIGSYEMLAQLPGFEKVIDKNVASGGNGDFTLPIYIRTLVRIAIGVIGMLSVVMIVVAGVQYMASEMMTEKEGARQKLTGAVMGLILAVSSVLLLRTINPQLLNLDIGKGVLLDCVQAKDAQGNLLYYETTKPSTDPNDPPVVPRVVVEKKGSDGKKTYSFQSGGVAPQPTIIKYETEACDKSVVVAEDITIPADLLMEYEQEDLPDNTINPDGKSNACKGGVVKIDTVNQKNLGACADIAENYKKMIAAAKNDGIVLTASGARTMEQQITLRKQNCGGSSQYNVYEKPSRDCHPQTARPGKSMHQQGLAFDIGVDGKTICFTKNTSVANTTKCRQAKNPGLLWLESNAKKYGFYNLPTEAWHWSINGK